MSESEVEAEEMRRLTAKARLLTNELHLDEALALMDRAANLRLAPLRDRLAARRDKRFILLAYRSGARKPRHAWRG